MRFTFEAKTYSRCRTTVMGLATIFVMWFHMNVKVEPGSLMETIKYMGDVGVDMFLLASGVGVYFALEKYASYTSFIGSRFRRVIPAFLLAAIPWAYYENIYLNRLPITSFLLDISTLNFWVQGEISCWYVPAILAIYLVAPFYVKAWKRWPKLNIAVLLGLYAALIFVPMPLQREVIGGKMIMIYRIPIFLIGLAFGKAVKEEKVFHLNVWAIVGMLAVSVLGILTAMGRLPYQIPGEYKYLFNGLFAIILSFFATKIPENPVTNYLGKRSLEVYLLHEKSQWFLDYQPFMWRLVEIAPLSHPLIALGMTLVGAEILRLLSKLICFLLPHRRVLDNPSPKR